MGVTAETVSRLCQQGQLAEAVDALGVLVLTHCRIYESVWYTVLRKCMGNKDLVLGRRVHALTVKQGYESDTFLCNHILRMYAAHARLQEAMDVFTGVARPDAFMWSSIISAHVRHGQPKQAIKLYHEMGRSSVKPDAHVFVAALQACARGADLRAGQQVHADVLASEVEPSLSMRSCLVDMYAKCGSLEDARRVFDGLSQKDVVTWNSMLTGYSQQGMGQETLCLYTSMQQEGITAPDSVTFVCLLQACASLGISGMEMGKELHRKIEERGLEADVSVGCSLVNMYAKCGSVQTAQSVFDGLSRKNVVTWTALIVGYSQQGMGKEALHVYSAMQEEGAVAPNCVTFVCLLQACATVGPPALENGKQIHAKIGERGLQADVSVANGIINMYSKCGSLEDARTSFDRLSKKDVVTWTTLIAGYSQLGLGQEALDLYSAMQEEGITAPDSVTFVSLLQACASVGTSALQKGKHLHEQLKEQELEDDIVVGCSLVNMYAKCGSVQDAQTVFDSFPQRNAVMWTALIAGYSQQSMAQEALDLYSAMQKEGNTAPDSVTFVRLLQACTAVGWSALGTGKQIHTQIQGQGLVTDAFVANSLINMYAKCGSLEDAQCVFDGISDKDIVMWNALIAGYSQHGMGQEALLCYRAMEQEGITVPDTVTFVCLLQACASLGAAALQKGKQLHLQIEEQGLQGDFVVGSSLVNMYAKCGSIHDAQSVFDGLVQKDVVTWNAIIAGYSQQGMGQEALHVYSNMQEGFVEPDAVTFVCLLKACASVGAVALKMGRQLHVQIEEQGLQADVFVANSLIKMYAQCGSVEDAQRLFDGLGRKDVVTWNALIAGYSQHGMGQEALRLYSGMQLDGIAALDSVTFVSLLQACASVGRMALEKGKELHAEIEEKGLQADAFVANSLLNMYAKCGSLEDAQSVFDGLCQKDVVMWNAMIAGYSQQGMGQEALRLYSAMQEEGSVVPDSVTFVCLLQACACIGTSALEKGKQLHAQIEEQRCEADVVVGSSLVHMYAKCGSVQDAQRVFDGMGQKDVITWNALMAGYCQQGMGEEALHLDNAMQEEGTTAPTSVTFLCLLQACAGVGARALEKGKQLHAEIRQRGLQADLDIGWRLVNMYAKCGSMEDAQSVFDGLDEKDVVTWNSMIAGYVQQGMGQEALDAYNAMKEKGTAAPDAVTFVRLLQACASLGIVALDKGKQLHLQIEEQGLQADAFIGCSLIRMYAKCGNLQVARSVFDELVHKDVVIWNGIIAGYSQQGMGQEALNLYSAMQEGTTAPDPLTFVCLLQACASVGALALEKGRELHTQIREQGLQADEFVVNSLINMYAKCGGLEDAQSLFDGLVLKDVVTWNSMIAGYSQQCMGQEALGLYSAMQEEGITAPDSVTFVCLLQACASVGALALEKGKQLHAQVRQQGLEVDEFVANSLINMYAKCGSLEAAQSLFDGLVQKDVVTWNAMIAGYAQQGMGQEALGLYSAMQQGGIGPPNSVTFVCLLQACAGVAALHAGRQLHVQIEEQGLQDDLALGNSLINMYAKCGSMGDAQKVFDSLPERQMVAWNALIAGYTRQGDSEAVFDLVHGMRDDGLQPDGITFLSVLTVCSHVGLVDEGQEYFGAMGKQYGITPTAEHYACMVDLLGRAGQLDDALAVARAMPVEPVDAVWHTLLGACRIWGSVEVGRYAFHEALKLDDKNAGAYVAMANIYKGAQMWEEAHELHERRKGNGAWKQPGQSWWTDMDGLVHSFVVGDSKLSETDGVHAGLKQLVPIVMTEGYLPAMGMSAEEVSGELQTVAFAS